MNNMNSMELGPPAPRRRPSLTPMIDVVFLLLVFFMLAAKFGQEDAIGLQLTGSGEGYSGPPRLVTVAVEGDLRLNGVSIELGTLAKALEPMMGSPEDLVVVRPQSGAEVQAMVDVLSTLTAAGIARIAIVE